MTVGLCGAHDDGMDALVVALPGLVDARTELAFVGAMVDAIDTHEAFGGVFVPSHPNARLELRRVAARTVGGRLLCGADRKSVDSIIDALLAHPRFATG